MLELTTKAEGYSIIEKRMYKEINGEQKYVPTLGERSNLIKHLHYLLCHAGFKKTIELARKYFYWPSIRKDILKILRNCRICQADNPRFMLPGGHHSIEKPKRPFLVVHVDLLYIS